MPSATFIGRRTELELLERLYRSSKSELLPIYGRRRVGKSELILRFMQRKPGLYYLAKQLPGPSQIQEFLKVLGRVTGSQVLAAGGGGGATWGEVLVEAVDRLRRGSRKVVLALDEFQWMAEGSPELPSFLQECWDRHWRDSKDVVVILCGSQIGFMEREILGTKSPLYGRRTNAIALQPFDHVEAALFHPSYSIVDKARTYFVCGGIPAYLRLFDAGKSVEMNLVELMVEPDSLLAREVDFLLREELREVAKYHALLMTLGLEKAMPAHLIAKALGMPATTVPYYLEQLRALGYVDRRFPLWDGRPSRKSVTWAISDPLLGFWFRFVYPQLNFLKTGNGWDVFRQEIQPNLDSYFGGCFERLCRRALPRLHAKEGVKALSREGAYWSKDIQVDVVSIRTDRVIELGECKWGTVRSPLSVEQELSGKVAAFPNPKGATILKRAFTRERVRPPKSTSATWHWLEDLYR